MKKKLLAVLSLLSCVALCVGGLASCGKKSNDKNSEEISDTGSDTEQHDLTWVKGTTANFETDGVIGHYTCSHCEKLFDKNKNEIEDVTIAKYSTHYGKEYKYFAYTDATVSEEEYDSRAYGGMTYNEYRQMSTAQIVDVCTANPTKFSVKFTETSVFAPSPATGEIAEYPYHVNPSNGFVYITQDDAMLLAVEFDGGKGIRLYMPFPAYLYLSTEEVHHEGTKIEADTQSCEGTVAHYVCTHCGYTFDENDKQIFLTTGGGVGHTPDEYGVCTKENCKQYVGATIESSNSFKDLIAYNGNLFFKFTTKCCYDAYIHLSVSVDDFDGNPFTSLILYKADDESKTDLLNSTKYQLSEDHGDYCISMKSEVFTFEAETTYYAIVTTSAPNGTVFDALVTGMIQYHDVDDDGNCEDCDYHCDHENGFDLYGCCVDCDTYLGIDLEHGGITKEITTKKGEKTHIEFPVDKEGEYKLIITSDKLSVNIYDYPDLLCENYVSGTPITLSDYNNEYGYWYIVEITNDTNEDITYTVSYTCAGEHTDEEGTGFCDGCRTMFGLPFTWGEEFDTNVEYRQFCYKVTFPEGEFDIDGLGDYDNVYLYDENGTEIEYDRYNEAIHGGKTYFVVIYRSYIGEDPVKARFVCYENNHTVENGTCTVCGVSD